MLTETAHRTANPPAASASSLRTNSGPVPNDPHAAPRPFERVYTTTSFNGFSVHSSPVPLTLWGYDQYAFTQLGRRHPVIASFSVKDLPAEICPNLVADVYANPLTDKATKALRSYDFHVATQEDISSYLGSGGNKYFRKISQACVLIHHGDSLWILRPKADASFHCFLIQDLQDPNLFWLGPCFTEKPKYVQWLQAWIARWLALPEPAGLRGARFYPDYSSDKIFRSEAMKRHTRNHAFSAVTSL